MTNKHALNSVLLHLLDQLVLLHDLLGHDHVEILHQLALVRHDALSRGLRLLEALDDVLRVLHLRRRGREHAIRDVHSGGVNQGLAIESELLALQVMHILNAHLDALLLESDEIAHVQVHAIQNHLVVLLRSQNHQLQGRLQGATRVHVQLLRQVARAHDDARVARKAAADLIGIENAAGRLDQTPNLLHLIENKNSNRLGVGSALLHDAVHLQNLPINPGNNDHLFRAFDLGQSDRVAARGRHAAKIVLSPRGFQTVDAHANLTQSVASLSHLLIHHLSGFGLYGK